MLLAAATIAVATWAAWERDEAVAAVVAEEAVTPRTLDAAATAGALVPGDARGTGGRLLDAYDYYTDTDEPLHVRVAGAFAPALTVRTPDGRVVAAPVERPDPHVAEVGGLSGKGRYVITVSTRDRGARGRYVLAVDERPVPFELVVDGQPREWTLGLRYRARADGRYEDRHAFEARRGQPYLALLTADSLFAHLVVRSPEGDSLGGVVYERLRTARGGYASVARFTPRYAGRYVVAAVSNEPGGEGVYELVLKTRTDPVAVGAEVVRGALGLVSRMGEGGRYVDAFTSSGQAGQRFEAEVRASGFAPTLTLYAPDGKAIATGASALVAVLPFDGRYRLEVSSTAPRRTGTYDLTLGPPAPPPRRPDTTANRRELDRDGGRK